VAETLRLAFAGICVEYRLGDPDLARMLRAEMGDFLSLLPPSLVLELEPLEEIAVAGYQPLRVNEDGEGLLIERHDQRCRIDLGRGCGEGVMAGNTYAFGTFLRGLYSRLLLDHQGLILHASAVQRRGRAHAFTGRTGSGKTTIALLSPENLLLTDELVILRRSATGSVLACGTPFVGESLGRGISREEPLTRLFHLVQAERNHLRPLPEQQALRQAMGQVMFFQRSPAAIDRLLGVCQDLLASLDNYELEFLPHPSVWEMIDGLD